MIAIKLGVTSRTFTVFVPDPASTVGKGKTGLAHTDMTVSYTRVETDNDVVVTDVTSSLNALTNLTDAHNDWGWKEVSATLAPGLYRLDVADAVFAAGAWSAVVYVAITSGLSAASPMGFQLVAYDPLDAVRLGLTALPNANAEDAGGLYTRGSGPGQINQNANGQVDTRVVAMANDTITAAAIATDAIDADAIADNAINAAAIATDAISAAKLAADAGTEIATAVWASAARTLTALDEDSTTLDLDATIRAAVGLASANLDTQIGDLPTNAELATALAGADDAVLAQVALVKAKTDNLPSDPADASDIAAAIAALPTAAQVADAVWDEDVADHNGAGSTGAALAAAGSAGDPWATPLPGAYTAGQAGKIIGDNINATISSRASQTSVDDVPTNAELATALGTADDAVLAQVALVKAKTDLIPGTADGKTWAQRELLSSAALLGKGGPEGNGTGAYRDLADTKDRVTFTYDANGKRTAVTLDAA